MPCQTLVVRTKNDPMGFAAIIRHEIAVLDPEQPIAHVARLDRLLEASTDQERFRTFLIGSFAGIALLLSAVGIYGVMAYTVNRRTGEIGVRMALGARPVDILKLILGENMTLTLLGVSFGLIGAGASHSLWGISVDTKKKELVGEFKRPQSSRHLICLSSPSPSVSGQVNHWDTAWPINPKGAGGRDRDRQFGSPQENADPPDSRSIRLRPPTPLSFPLAPSLVARLRHTVGSRIPYACGGWSPRPKPQLWASVVPQSWLAQPGYRGARFESERGNLSKHPAPWGWAGGFGTREEGGKEPSPRIRRCYGMSSHGSRDAARAGL
jgi:hypothetical protein